MGLILLQDAWSFEGPVESCPAWAIPPAFRWYCRCSCSSNWRFWKHCNLLVPTYYPSSTIDCQMHCITLQSRCRQEGKLLGK